MEKIGLNKLREMFLSFYASKEHYRRGSFSLIPQNDKSLLIINSGMAPLKPYFAGLEKPPAPRMTTCQKCIRTDDIENVGVTDRHGTFFEMLGSFSFGDYFKEESVTWGWEFITEVLKMPEEKVWVTVYEDDDEAYDIWNKKIGVPKERIVRLGKDDNFWEIGTGPCGPCSEIYFDRGEKYGCGDPDCKPGCDCDRYIEFWNHVFTQFSKQEDGTYADLEHKNIDTGMGLERLACIMQGVDCIFDIDTIKYVLDAVCEITNTEYHDGEAPTDTSIRIITDHIRSATFMISDNIMPSNEGRGYVLRRLIRRAYRHGRKLGIEGHFLAQLVDKVIESSKEGYPGLLEQEVFIKKIVEQEEDRFSKTLSQGLGIIEGYIDEMANKGETVLAGDKAFKLHDTYGFPFEITEEILSEKGYTVNREEFEESMAKQKELGKKVAAQSDEAWKESAIDHLFETKTEFTGYTDACGEGTVVALFEDQEELEVIEKDAIGRVIFDRTPFYAKGGGQASDIGMIQGDGFKAEVLEVNKYKETFAHKIKVLEGSIKKGDKLTLCVNEINRNNSARNHTCTHLLHKALREVLGEHVHQAGSAVDSSMLRFDFAHYEAMTPEQIKKVEAIVNDEINKFLPVTSVEMPFKDASESGALGLFEDKYGDVVRVVSVGDFSKELCGGIHVSNSGQIGAFKIVSESGIAAGVRRIEAVTGYGLLQKLIQGEALIEQTAAKFKVKPNQMLAKVESVIAENKQMSSELESLKKQSLNAESGNLIETAKDVNGVKLITKLFKDVEVADIRSISDELKANNENLVMVFATEVGGKGSIIVSITKDAVAKGLHAGKLVKEIAQIAGGNGGGKPDMAQAGAKDLSKLQDAIDAAEGLLK